MTRRRNDGPPLPAALVLNTMPASPCGTTTGSSFAYVYFENEPGRLSAAKAFEARRIAANIAKLPELARKP
jgi:hypothetical protein